MLAYVYEGDGRLVLKNMPEPVAKRNSAVIKVNACSICGTDFRTYIYGSKKIVPGTIIGHEVCGIVVDAGNGVAGLYPGDRVAVAPAIGCGKCYSCIDGHPNMCDALKSIGFQYQGGFAEYMEIPEQALIMGNVNKLGNLIEDEEAALAEPIACVVNSHEYLKIKEGDNVTIFGSGFIGCIHAELAFSCGAEKVIMIEIAKNRAEEASRHLSQVQMINPNQNGGPERIFELTGGRGTDVAILACSVGKAQEDAIRIAAKRGRISLFGGIPGESKGFIDSNEIHYKELSVYGVHASTPLQNKKVLDWILCGKLKVKKYITRVMPLEGIVEAFEAIKNENIMKVVIRP